MIDEGLWLCLTVNLIIEGGQWSLIERGCLACAVIIINRERDFNFMKNIEFVKNRFSAQHEGGHKIDV